MLSLWDGPKVITLSGFYCITKCLLQSSQCKKCHDITKNLSLQIFHQGNVKTKQKTNFSLSLHYRQKKTNFTLMFVIITTLFKIWLIVHFYSTFKRAIKSKTVEWIFVCVDSARFCWHSSNVNMWGLYFVKLDGSDSLQETNSIWIFCREIPETFCLTLRRDTSKS